MKRKTLWIAAVCAVALVGCKSWWRTDGEKAGSAATTTATACENNLSSGSPCAMKVLPGGATVQLCTVTVTKTATGIRVVPYTLNVPPPAVDPPPFRTRIVWTVTGAGNEFHAGDGPNILPGDTVLLDPGPTDDPDGAPGAGTPAKRFRTVFANRSNTKRPYTLSFHTPQGQVSCDPLISNQSD